MLIEPTPRQPEEFAGRFGKRDRQAEPHRNHGRGVLRVPLGKSGRIDVIEAKRSRASR